MRRHPTCGRLSPHTAPLRTSPCLPLLVALWACSGTEAALPTTHGSVLSFTDLFAHVGGFEVDSATTPALLDVTALAVEPGGALLVLDGSTGILHRFGRDGAALASSLASDGVRFDGPLDVAVTPTGSIYVAGAPVGAIQSTRDAPVAAVSRVSGDLTDVTVLEIPGLYFVTRVVPVGDALALGLLRPRGPGDDVALVDEQARFLSTFHPQDERARTVPYWGSWFTTFIAPSERGVLAVNSLYPIVEYGKEGDEIRTFGTPSGTFRLPAQPDTFQFSGPQGRAQYEEWRRTFTRIDGIHTVGTSTVLVQLVDLAPETQSFSDPSYRLDAFSLAAGDPIARDLVPPGRVVHADSLLYVVRRPSGGNWQVDWYRPKEAP